MQPRQPTGKPMDVLALAYYVAEYSPALVDVKLIAVCDKAKVNALVSVFRLIVDQETLLFRVAGRLKAVSVLQTLRQTAGNRT